jgi:hypothetical protein
MRGDPPESGISVDYEARLTVEQDYPAGALLSQGSGQPTVTVKARNGIATKFVRQDPFCNFGGKEN